MIASGPHRRDELRAFLAATVGKHANQFDLDQRIPRSVIAQLAEAGILGAQVPRQFGGTEYDAFDFGHVCELVGYASGSLLSLLTVHSIVASTIVRWGSAAQKERWLPLLASGASLGAFALSEADVGSDARNVGTRIRREGDTFVVNGAKKWISCGQIADLFLIVGNCDGRVIGLIVEADNPGLSIAPISDMLGFKAAMLAEITLDECVVAQNQLLGSVDFGYAQVVGSVLDHGRFSIAWGCVGLAQACIDASLNYTETRQTFGQYLKDHQLVQKMIADMVTNTQAARLLCEDAARKRAAGDHGGIMATTMAKYFAARNAETVAAEAVQLHGANGCSNDYPLARHYRDAKIMSIIEGSAQMQQILIAQHSYGR